MHPPNQSSCFHLFIVFNLECNENQWYSRPLKTQESLKIEWLLWYFCWCQRIEVYNNDTHIIRKGWKVTLTLHFLSPLSWISWASWQLARWPQQRTVATSSQVLPWTVRAVPAFLLLFILVSTLRFMTLWVNRTYSSHIRPGKLSSPQYYTSPLLCPWGGSFYS